MEIESHPVLEIVPDFTENPPSSARQSLALVALSQAPRIAAWRSKRIVEGFTQRFTFRSRAEIAAFEQFFDGRSGRHLPFWMPSWRADLALRQDVALSATSLSISAVNYSVLFNPLTDDSKSLGHYLYLVKPDLTTFAPGVASLGVASVIAETLNLDSAATDEFPVISTVVCFLHFVRFLSDELTLRYSGPNSAACEMGFVEVVTSEVEADV